MKILIVEDNEANLHGLTRLVKHAWKIDSIELEIVGVSTLAQALLEADSANVTILDLDLPDSDIASTMQAIPKFRPPVIVLTGTDDPDVTATCMKYGADHVFAKGYALGLVSAIFESLQKDVIRRAEARSASSREGEAPAEPA